MSKETTRYGLSFICRKCPRCNGSGSLPPGSGRATPSPAFHREGREQFCPEKTQKNWTTDGRSAPVAVPEKVEARLEAAEELARFAEWSFEGDDDAIVFCPPEMEDSTRAALARFRSTGGKEQ